MRRPCPPDNLGLIWVAAGCRYIKPVTGQTPPKRENTPRGTPLRGVPNSWHPIGHPVAGCGKKLSLSFFMGFRLFGRCAGIAGSLLAPVKSPNAQHKAPALEAGNGAADRCTIRRGEIQA